MSLALQKPYGNTVRCRCFSTNVTPRHRHRQLSTLPSPCLIDTHDRDHPSKSANWFPSTPSEYEAYRANLNASSNNTPSSIPRIPSTQYNDAVSSSPVINFVIPSLPLNLGLGRITVTPTSSSSPSSSAPHRRQSLCPSLSTTNKSRRRVSKSDISEANWWIKMYESLVWHMQDCGEPSSHELAFLERLENKVQCRWYPIAEKAREQSQCFRDDERLGRSRSLSRDGCSFAAASASVSQSAGREQGPAPQAPHHYHQPMLDPAQLAAQAILRRSQASQKPLRRKRFASPGCSALRREIALAA